MKQIAILTLICVSIVSNTALIHAAGPSDEFARNAFKQILSQADTNKDGKLSIAECTAMYKDPARAKKNCNFWDADHDGTITEDEYASKAMSMGRKR
ncbi:MAG: EF-hand domain-containing protein [Eubacteriales bacterium]|nr:EF-hand domain-containing protein [Eubacteriales bacterium]